MKGDASDLAAGWVSDWGYSLQFRTRNGRLINIWRYERLPEVWTAYEHEHERRSYVGNAIEDYDAIVAKLEADRSPTNDGRPVNWRLLKVLREHREWLETELRAP